MAFFIAGFTNPALVTLGLVFCSAVVFEVKASILDPSLISQELRSFANNALGVDELQEYFNRLSYDTRNIDGAKLTEELALKMQEKFTTRFDVARRLRNAVEASYLQTPSTATAKQCCEIDKSTLIYDERFRTKVDLNNVCLKISGSAPPDPIHLDSGAILKEAKNILKEYSFIKWQYFGSEKGVMTNFPVFNDSEPCDGYDPRFRPFYVETAIPEAKDVLLVIDTSRSMEGNMKIAKEAAKTLLDTINPKDQIGVVSFNDEASTYTGSGVSPCYSQQLALAVPTNIDAFKAYVESLTGEGNSIYEVAFEKACSLLKAAASEKNQKNRKRVILFLTNGHPSDTNSSLIFKTIRDCNTELNNSIIIFTFGIGTVNQEMILKDIATLNTKKYGFFADRTVGDITPGNYTHIDGGDVRIKIATYFNYLPTVNLEQPVVSVPYVDAFGTGLLMSITLPCYDSEGKFIGVAGTDVNIEDLLSDITFFNQDRKTYAFMISSSGRTLIHPLLPIPDDPDADPIFLHIKTLEPDAEFEEVFNSMTSGSSGLKTFPATRYLPRGGDMLEGVTVTTLESTYYWSPIGDTGFSIAVVVPVGFRREVLSTLQLPQDYSFHYHRIDLISPSKPCLHFQNVVSNGTTVVKFAPGAYFDPYAYIGAEETNVTVQILESYMLGRPNGYNKLKGGIRDTVIATWKVEKLWLRDKTELTQYLAWRYIGTANGVFRQTPGSELPNTYDPRDRPWYHTALSHSGRLILTTPYLDVGGAGEVIAIARSLYHQESTENVLAVVGADFTLRYFYRLLTKVYPICNDTSKYACFVMDNAGFMVFHVDFLQSSATEEQLEHVHITQKERHIAEDLISKSYLIKKECRNVETIKKQSFYEVKLPPGGVDELRGISTCKYRLGVISGTNVYIGVAVRDSFCRADKCFCALNGECSLSNLICECPCTSSLEFDYCRSLFPNSSVPLCPPISRGHIQPHSSQLPDKTECLEKCFDARCPDRRSSKLCDGTAHCYWCLKNKDDLLLDKPYCASSERCFRGKESATVKIHGDEAKCNPTSSSPKPSTLDSKSLLQAEIAGISIGCIAFLLLVIVLVVFGLKRCRNLQPGPPTRDERKPSTQKIPPCTLRPSAIPDVLVRSIHNDSFETYDEIVELRPPANDQDAHAPDKWPPSYNQVQRKYSDNPPAYPGRTRGDQPPPVPNTRRPSAFDSPRQRSRTDPPPMEEILMTTMPREPCDFNRTSVKTKNNRGMYANCNDTQPGISPMRNGSRKQSIASLPDVRSRKMSVFDQRPPLPSGRDEHPPVQVPRKQSLPSLRKVPSRPEIWLEDQPPPLVPRVTQLSNGTINTENSPERGRHVYSNVASVIPEEGPLSSLSDNDDTDAHGYVTVIKN
ncbi:VWFA and cache domain-containing protein 1-like [Montipora foliosa]|uniref:VWFA and cache domain-containing protein 1-like n=1 Tax=Montipora foliosa TaxID=591990 RepID=UPI0035F121E2